MHNKKPKILILSFTNHEKDPRVNRQIQALLSTGSYEIFTAGTGKANIITNEHFLKIAEKSNNKITTLYRLLCVKLGLYKKYIWDKHRLHETANDIKKHAFQLIIANDLEPFVFACQMKLDAKIIFDAHEYYPRELDSVLYWRFLFMKMNFRLCKKYIPKAVAMFTVCNGIQEEYKNKFHVSAEIILNAPEYQVLSPIPVNKAKIRLIHHGNAMSSRFMELMIDIMKYTDERYTLDFMLVASNFKSQEYLETLKAYAANNLKIRFIEPVSFRDIPHFINQYDMGIHILRPKNFNDRFALPNKFFEFIQARLGIITGPSEEMMSYIKQYSLGVCSTDFSPQNIAAVLNKLTYKEIQQFKNNAHKSASELSSEKGCEIILNKTNELLS